MNTTRNIIRRFSTGTGKVPKEVCNCSKWATVNELGTTAMGYGTVVAIFYFMFKK